MNTPKQRIAVIGAGFSGAVFSAKMVNAGYSVTVFEKSRGTGGRLSSCRLGDSCADLGAPVISALTPEFDTWLSEQPDLDVWYAHSASFEGQDLGIRPHWVVKGRQSALTRRLLADVSLQTEVRVSQITSIASPNPSASQLQLFSDHLDDLGIFDQVVITAPAPQAVPLLKDISAFQAIAAAAIPSVSWMLVVQLKHPSGLAFDLFEGPHPIFLRGIKNSAKPNRATQGNSEIWVFEANATWSGAHQDHDSRLVQAQLLDAFNALLQQSHLPAAEIEQLRVHRWLYARHTQVAHDIGSLWDPHTGLAACGDWLEKGDLEAAWRSANALADQMLRSWA